MSAPRPASARPQRKREICLCMIVRDEADVLAGSLASCRAHIDSWVICDTGSSDGTQDLIRHELEGIPGELHERAWVDFGHNRSELMALARGRADYLLLLDAGMTIELHGDPLGSLRADAYLVRHAGESRYHTLRLVSGRLRWRYVGAAHEYITAAERYSTGRLDDLVIHPRAPETVRPGRAARNAALLQAALERDPSDARSLFYLAQTWRDLGDETDDRQLLSAAREAYERRARMGGWAEEHYCALHQAGLLYARLGDWPSAMARLLMAWQVRPERLEAVHYLAAGLIERRHHRTALQFTSLASPPARLRVPDDVLFVEPWVYEWGMLFQHAIATYWCGDYDGSIDASRRLLASPSLPEDHRRQTQDNLHYALRQKAGDRLAKLHAGAPQGP